MAQGSGQKGDSPGTSMARAAHAALGIDDAKTVDIPSGPPPETSDVRPREATVAIYLMLVTGAIALALSVYWMAWGGNLLGGILVLFLGIAYLYGGRALRDGESWGWGAGVFAGIFFALFGIFLLPFGAILVVLAVVVMVLLFRVRSYFGMVRYDPGEDDKKKQELETLRTSNPEALHCPRCGSTRLWIAPDGSAFCLDCKTGTISLRRPA